MAGGIALLLVFVLIEGRFAKAPMMPLRIYSSRTLSAANLVVLLIGAAVFAMWFFVSLYLQQVLGYSPIEAGLSFLPMTSQSPRSRPSRRGSCAASARSRCSCRDAAAGRRTAAVHRHRSRRQLPRERARTFAARRERDGAGVRAGDDLRGRGRRAARRRGLRRASSTPRGCSAERLASRSSPRSRPSRTNSDLHHATARARVGALTDGFEFAFVVAAAFALAGALVAIFGLPRIAPAGAGQRPEERTPAAGDRAPVAVETH